MYKLKLYITGHTPRSQVLVSDLIILLDKNCDGNYTLEVIDVFDHPDVACEDGVLVTPTLIKKLPPPVRRIVGSLKDEEKLLATL